MAVCPACSFEFNPAAKKPRSVPAHNRYFAVIGEAYKNWPINHQLKPMNAEDVRTYLQLRAGWGQQLVSKATGEVYLIPRSIKFSEMRAAEFNELSARVYRILHEETGMDHEKLLEGKRQLQCA